MAVGCAAVPLEARAVKVVDVVDVVTVTVTGNNHPTAAPKPTTPAAANNGGGFLEGASAPPKPAPAPTSVNIPAPAPSSGGDEFGSVVNKYRSAYGLSQLGSSSQLISNAQQVGESNGGVNENHSLIPNIAMGQCITPGQAHSYPANQQYSPFELAYLAWLCEVPSDEQLQPAANGGVNPCSVVNEVLHMEYSDTGHHQILVDPQWKSYGCAYVANPNANQYTSVYQGIYTCNFSPDAPDS
jgi:Cysteine-rich secretory protein family